MNLMELKKALKDSDKLDNLYIFYGNEITIREIYIQKICNKFKGNIKSVESLSSIYKNLANKSPLIKTSNLYIIRDDLELLNAKPEVWDKLKSPKFMKDNIVILVYNTFALDKRSKFYKRFSDDITTFEFLSENVLAKYIKKQLPNLSTDRCIKLVKICENDYTRILLEVDKLINLMQSKDIREDVAFDIGDKNCLFNPPVDYKIFDLINAIVCRNIPKSLYLYKLSKLSGDNDLAILSLLYNNFRNLYQLKLAGTNKEKDLVNITGLTLSQIRGIRINIDKYTIEELDRNVRCLNYCIASYKNGNMLPDMIMDYVLCNIL